MLAASLSHEVGQFRKELFNFTYSEVEEKKNKLVELQKQVIDELARATQDNKPEEVSTLQNTKDAVDGLVMIAEAIQKEIEHQIWVRSRDATEEVAKELVPEIPDQIMLNLSKAPQHNGAPRMLLQTQAFRERLKKLV